MDRINFLNIFIDNISLSYLLKELTEKGGFIVTPNVDHLVKLQKDADFLKAYKIADYVVCDSKIIQYVLKFLGKPVPEKISGSDLFPAFYHYNQDNNEIKIFLLGGEPEVAQKAQNKINQKVGREIIVSALSPSFGFENNSVECFAIIDQINKSGANVIAIGVGAPKQEKWIVKYRSLLPNVKIFLPIGATIDFEAEHKTRSPKWMSNIGLEWFYRLICEPKRLWKRYLVDSIPFLIHTLQYRFDIYKNNPIMELKSMPLGMMLNNAGLLSNEELTMILETQKQKNYQVKLGQIIENFGFLPQETITFFAEELLRIIESNQSLPLGDYLQKAHLISSSQIDDLSKKQEQLFPRKKIHELILESGYLSQKTLDWFIKFQFILKSHQQKNTTFEQIYEELETITSSIDKSD
ncbi:WecB/TagA/CpsF family glycosyltransferase [Geminocystis sp. GBBB08]|uniref:WecB/TagA/CpsF family glycosyltransferase n=1 Tax=Geminocystis sp. GBBB08 TaxID=2604140 RepID=UPI0027E23ED7|nr:WecB/TagA/CpsF family glycosyltransferase [Geminocystis sp. GBBB08]MBL1211655.1 WecB/TagA/CpsF family glycosyltransferase [Geminocystis sp. GBBB08]